jgi:hypothetical protein
MDADILQNIHNPIFFLLQVPPRFGLIDTSNDRWAKFEAHIRQLNQDSPIGTTYKFFLLSRHGQGYRMNSMNVSNKQHPSNHHLIHR